MNYQNPWLVYKIIMFIQVKRLTLNIYTQDHVMVKLAISINSMTKMSVNCVLVVVSLLVSWFTTSLYYVEGKYLIRITNNSINYLTL